MTNKNEIAGKAQQVKGAVKRKVGEWTGDPDLRDEGVVDEAVGKVREVAGTVQKKVEHTARKVKRAVDR